MASIVSKDKEEPLELKQGGSKVFSKLFTRESSAAAPSFRVYYGVASAGSVPFLWESQPGTPKNDAVSAATLPPLTPPPSYYTARQQATHHKSSSAAPATSAGGKKHPKQYISILSAILPKIILHRRRSSRSSSSSGGSPTASSCSSSSSSSAFSSSSASSLSFRSAQSPAACSSMRSRVYAFSVDSEDERPAAPTTCFSVRHESFRAFNKGCRVAMTVKSALASVGGHGHGPAAPTATASAQKV